MKWFIYIAIITTIVATISGGYLYISNIQEDRAQLREERVQLQENQRQLEQNLQQSNEAVDELQRQYERIQEQYENAQRQFREIRETNEELRERLGRHDIGALAEVRPGLIENIINNASKEATRCFELLSGAPLNQKERNAETAREFNSECPWLWEDYNESNR